MNDLTKITALLEKAASTPKENQSYFYKTGPGDYAEHDQFMGINTKTLRDIAKTFSQLSLQHIEPLIKSPFNDKRLLALFILVGQYEKGDAAIKEAIFNFYKAHLSHVNNWNLVDSSAHYIVGAHLFTRERDPLITLAKSTILWERRVAIVSTWYFIKKNDLNWTFKLAELLLNDPHDLMHKAVGWMLREAGKKDIEPLKNFLKRYAPLMPRTMLRYSIEKMSKEDRLYYMGL